MKTSLHLELSKLLDNENFGDVMSRARNIIQEYKNLQQHEPVITSEDSDEQEGEENALVVDEEIDHKMQDLIKEYNLRWRKYHLAKKEAEQRNLTSKKALITELKDLIENEENIGRAFARVKAIEEKWKETGPVPREDAMEIQNEYGRVRDQFYHNIRIYKELQEHDLKKNYSLKNQVAHEMEGLKKNNNIKEVEKKFLELRSKWDEIGPVPNEHWDELKNKYFDTTRAIYDVINTYYEKLRGEQQVIAEKKKTLLGEISEVVKANPASHKEWDEASKKIRELQEAWKNSGVASKKDERELWKEMRTQCDDFFQRKNAFYEARNEVFNAHRSKKEELVKKAEDLAQSSDWQKTASELINLQKIWKEAGYAGPKHENKLWTKFRKACDTFFERRDAETKAAEKALEANIELREAVLKQMEAWNPGEDLESALNEIKDLEQKFHQSGDIPQRAADAMSRKLKTTLNACYAKLPVGETEREMMVFRSYTENIKSDKHALEDTYKKIRTDKARIEQDLNQIETNLAFFGKSSKKNPILDQFTGKIEEHKAKLELLNQQMKHLRKLMA